MKVGDIANGDAAANGKPLDGIRVLALEQMQCLPHGGARDAQFGGDLLLLDARLGPQPAARDRLAQRSVHAVGELLLIVEGGKRHGRILYPIQEGRVVRLVSTTLTA